MRDIVIRNCPMGYSCAQDYSKLTETSNSGVLFCDSCQKEVYWCDDKEDIVQSIIYNRAIAFQSTTSDKEQVGKAKYAAPMSEPDFDFDDDIPF